MRPSFSRSVPRVRPGLSVATALGVLIGLLAGCGTQPSAPSAGPTSTIPSASTGAAASPSGSASGATSGAASGAASASATPSPSSDPTAALSQLPGGGRTIFPTYRMVGYVGYPGSPALGQLGIGDLDSEVDALVKRGHSYTDGRKLMPVLELIAVVVQGDPGPSGKYRARVSDSVIRTYLDAARRHHAMLLLNVQPGRSDFLTEVESLDKWLAEPDVGLALDPEWAMGPGQVPGRTYGSTTGDELNEVGAHVAAIVKKNDLPQKAIVYHQVAVSVVEHQSDLKRFDGVAWVNSVDGIGTRAEKTNTYDVVHKYVPDFVHPGFKLFFHEDRQRGSLMSAKQVLALDPEPDYVMYE